MNYLQASIENQKKLKSKCLNLILILNFLAIIATFAFNFLGLPILKYHYLFHVILSIFAVIYFEIPQIFPIILTLFFIEGQGRIIWEYNNWVRVIFDFIIFIAIIKVFINRKKIFNRKYIPIPLIIFISLHFCWYFVEIFNIHSVSIFAVLSATKIYIYPLLLFLALSQIDFKIESKKFESSIHFFIFILVLEIILSYFQFIQKQNLLLKISPYYMNAMKDGVFTEILFRPFATTQLPGAIAAFLYLTVGLLFLKKNSKKYFLLKILLLLISGFTIITCQIRSAFVKYILIIVFIQIGELLYDRFRSRATIISIIILISLIIGIPNILMNQTSTGNEGLDYARNRIATLNNPSKLKSNRLTLSEFIQILQDKLIQFPLGVGPGLTGAAGGMMKNEIAQSPFIRNSLWTFDNLIISLVIDFGVGSIFYLMILSYIPIYFLHYLMKFYKNKNHSEYQVLLVCFVSIFVILIGNWGAIGITYNPESFIFWFFAGLGFNTISKAGGNFEST